MWPLSIVLLVAAAPQQNSPSLDGAYVGKIPLVESVVQHNPQTRRMSPDQMMNRNTCYTVRSYHFERHDGNAPVLTGMTTCTPSRILEQKRVSPSRGLYVPLSLQTGDQKQPE
jgi:hypothetical protein